MSFFSQRSYFSTQTNKPLPDFSQDLFTTQDCLVSPNDLSQSQILTAASSSRSQFYQTANSFSTASLIHNNNDRKDHEDQDEMEHEVNFSQEVSRFFINQQSGHLNDNSFAAGDQAEIDFLHQNSQFIFNESQEMEGIDEDYGTDHEQAESQVNTFATPFGTQNSQSAPSSTFQTLNQRDNNETYDQHSDDDSSEPDDDSIIPKSILQMFKELKKEYSDWTFVSTLVGCLCNDSFPMGTYNNLKLSLLLSIVSVGQSEPIAIVAIGSETSHANTLMNSVGKLAQRFVRSTMAVFESSTDVTNIAGPLLMAKTGVFSIGDWSRLPSNTALKMYREIETGCVIAEKLQQSDVLECAVWTYWSSSTKFKKDLSSINKFMNVFGIPIMIDDSAYNMDILDDMFNLSSGSSFHITDDDMRNFLSYVSKQQVKMEPDSDEMLREYFTAMRMIRPDALSAKAFAVLQQMAKAHAKLCLRNTVNFIDVLAAVNISEKYIRVFFDKDSYSSPDEPKFAKISDIDLFYNKLKDWFTRFTQNILGRPI